MEITVNGNVRTVASGTSLETLICDLGLKPGSTVVEKNGAVLERARIRDDVLADGDVLEFVRFVGGG